MPKINQETKKRREKRKENKVENENKNVELNNQNEVQNLETKANECKDEIVINKNVGVEKQTISDDAKAILAIIYKDFLAQKDEKEKLEKELAETLDSDYIEKNEEDKTNTEMVIYKEESKLKKIFNRIKRFFSKK